MRFPFYRQYDSMDCGPSCVRMIAKYYGKDYSLQSLINHSNLNRDGISLRAVYQIAERIGFQPLAVRITLQQLRLLSVPCILHWNKKHFVVLHKIIKGRYHVADPAKGKLVYNERDFLARWTINSAIKDSIDEPIKASQNESNIIDANQPNLEGIALLMEPSASFYQMDDSPEQTSGFSYILKYLSAYRGIVFKLFLVFLLSSAFQLLLPFLTQLLIDKGIGKKDIDFIYLIVFAQAAILIGRLFADLTKNWLLLIMSTRINFSILSEFLAKLMKLPVSFFEARRFGDIVRRIDDHERIEKFLTGSSISTLFSSLNVAVYGFVLFGYDITIALVFFIGSIIYGVWIVLFFEQRRIIDFKRFELDSKEENKMLQLIYGMQEIKIANAESQKKQDWDQLQNSIIKLLTQTLTLNQSQQIGAFFINEGKNLLIVFLAAKAVVDGHISLGSMVAIQYIIGQLNSPIEQMIQFLQSSQDAKISLERINQVHQIADEYPILASNQNSITQNSLIQNLSIPNPPNFNQDLIFRQVSYQYNDSEKALKDINLTIPCGRVTAIVGTSGSGKTTLLKLLLRFYEPSQGEIYLGKQKLATIQHSHWRRECGVVLQDGFIFSDTIAGNIALGDEKIDFEKLEMAIQISNIKEYVDSLPMGYMTLIGAEGNGLSQGQKQRILIARSVYKNPSFLLFDEATNALDANNESTILSNLGDFFKGRTVIVVAHRLSTVKNADQIIVLEKGKIIEKGTHSSLLNKEGKYFDLIKNQLEIGL